MTGISRGGTKQESFSSEFPLAWRFAGTQEELPEEPPEEESFSDISDLGTLAWLVAGTAAWLSSVTAAVSPPGVAEVSA